MVINIQKGLRPQLLYHYRKHEGILIHEGHEGDKATGFWLSEQLLPLQAISHSS